MLISIDWIRDFVNVPDLPVKDIYTKFTLTTAEVEDVVVHNEHLKGIVVAEIISFEKHPEADKLNLVTFKISETDVRKVVCGANNVKVGIKVPFAPLGTKLPGGLVLEAKKIRGILSEGMLCSEEELGFADESHGLMELSSNSVVGTNMLDLFNLRKDTIFDIDNKSLTHRPDLWGHFGMAREFSAMYSLPLKNPFSDNWFCTLRSTFSDEKSPIMPKLKGESAVLSYWGISIDGVKVEESPEWMKSRLKLCGLRPINNIVDISNYVMLELGLPLHIFDRNQISGNEVIINRMDSEFLFKTLDGVERKLIPGDTVICDSNQPLVLAGIMGGLSSGVSDSTDKIFIEVANWKSSQIRRTSTRLGLRTDSSQRFEKTLDSNLTERSLLRALELVLQLCPAARVVGKAEYVGEDLKSDSTFVISSSFHKIRAVLGTDVSNEKIISILNMLDFKTLVEQDLLKVYVPSYRATKDIDQEADLIEEIGRVVGYDNIIPVSPLDSISPVKLSEIQKIQRRIREFMILQGKSFEVMTYPLIGENLLSQVSWPACDNLKLINSLSVDHNLMRPSLIPSILEVSSVNIKNFERFRFFELGRSYVPDERSFSKESIHLGGAFFDKDKSTFIDLSNVMSNLLSSLNLSFEFVDRSDKFPNSILPKDWVGLHPFEYTNIRIFGKFIGAIFSVHPIVLRSLKIKGHLAICVFDLSVFDNFKSKDKTKYKPLSKFPSSSFDWTVTMDLDSNVVEAITAAKKVKLKELQSVEILDIFPQASQKFVTLRATLADESATLNADMLKNAEVALVDATSKAGFVLK